MSRHLYRRGTGERWFRIIVTTLVLVVALDRLLGLRQSATTA